MASPRSRYSSANGRQERMPTLKKESHQLLRANRPASRRPASTPSFGGVQTRAASRGSGNIEKPCNRSLHRPAGQGAGRSFDLLRRVSSRVSHQRRRSRAPLGRQGGPHSASVAVRAQRLGEEVSRTTDLRSPGQRLVTTIACPHPVLDPTPGLLGPFATMSEKAAPERSGSMRKFAAFCSDQILAPQLAGGLASATVSYPRPCSLTVLS